MTLRNALIAGSLATAILLAATQAQEPAKPRASFDVASVRRAVPGATVPTAWIEANMKKRTRVPGREHGRYTNYQTSLRVYLQMAYGLPEFRIVAPEWMASERYDITASMPATASDDEVLEMLQTLLAERFQMKMHHEQRLTNVYAIVAAKGGAKLKEASEGEPPIVRITPVSMDVQNRSLNDLAGILMRYADQPVVNMTGLDGYYDFRLDWRADPPAASASPQPAMAAARDSMAPLWALSSLGLKAETRKVPLDYLVIDHAEKTPLDN